MINYDQLIWEACGRPMRRQLDCPHMNTHENCACKAPIDITLAHVMQLLNNNLSLRLRQGQYYYTGHSIIFISFEGGKVDMDFLCAWRGVKGNNEAANCADQSDETKQGICKVVRLV